jgi:hypothetical protein
MYILTKGVFWTLEEDKTHEEFLKHRQVPEDNILAARHISAQLIVSGRKNNGYDDIPRRHLFNPFYFIGEDRKSVCIPCGYFEEAKVSKEVLIDLEIYLQTEYSHDLGIARTYMYGQELEDALLEAKFSTIDNLHPVMVDILTRKRVLKASKSTRYDEKRNSFPEKIVEAMAAIPTSLINVPATIAYLRRTEEKIKSLRRQYGPNHKEYRLACDQFHNDSGVWNVIRRQGLSPSPEHGPGIYTYPTAFEVQLGGRIGFVGGGPTCASKKMKGAMYSGIEGLINYDIRSAQVHALLFRMKQAGIECEWLESYVNNPRGKYELATKVGVSEEFSGVLKTAVIQECMCAHNSDDISKVSGHSSLYKLFKKEFPDNWEEVWQRYNQETVEFRKSLRRFRSYLWKRWLPQNAKYLKDGKRYWVNATGMKLHEDKLDEVKSWQRKMAKLSAFLLQGDEACFIHNLTLLSEKYDFMVYMNEYDGLITIGEIPVEAVAEAQRISRMTWAILEIKEFYKECQSQEKVLQPESEWQRPREQKKVWYQFYTSLKLGRERRMTLLLTHSGLMDGSGMKGLMSRAATLYNLKLPLSGLIREVLVS